MDACGRDASIGARAMGSAGLGRRPSDDGTKLPGLAVTDRKPGKVRTETTAGRLPLGSAASTGRT
jgi:hypothetical protein